MDAVGFAVVDHDPVGVKLGRGVGRTRIKRCLFALRNFLDQAVKLRSRRLVKAGLVFQLQDADGFQQAQRAGTVGIGRIFRRLERHLHVALGGQVIDFVGLGFLDDADQIGRIRHVAIVQDEARILFVRILIDVLDASRVERRGAPLHPVHDISLFQQQLCQIGPVLTRNTRYQSNFLRLLAHNRSSNINEKQ